MIHYFTKLKQHMSYTLAEHSKYDSISKCPIYAQISRKKHTHKQHTGPNTNNVKYMLQSA